MQEWTYEGKPVTDEMVEGAVGFVYLIENLVNQKKYIGKKLFSKSKTYQKNKKKKRKRVESNWRSYFGSSDIVKAEVEKYGSENFKRTILKICKTKSEMSYHETKEQLMRDVLLRDDYYNDWISVRLRKAHFRRKGKT